MMRLAFVAVVTPLLLIGVGCSRGPERAPLSGKVSIDGVPVRFGAIVVTSEDEKYSTSGSISDDGTYLVPNAPVGPVKVSVSVPDRPNVMLPTGGKVSPKMSDQLSHQAPVDGVPPELAEAAASVPPIPAAYHSPASSGLTTTVAKEGSSYDVKMTSAAPASSGKGGNQPRPPGLPPNMPWPPK